MDTDQVTLLGRTGAGKSTILKLLLGLYEPDQGQVLLHGIPATAVRAGERTETLWIRRADFSHGAGNRTRPDYII